METKVIIINKSAIKILINIQSVYWLKSKADDTKKKRKKL